MFFGVQEGKKETMAPPLEKPTKRLRHRLLELNYLLYIGTSFKRIIDLQYLRL